MFTPYERITFVTPIVDGCPFFGEANPTEVLLNGRLFRALAAHELGHTLSLGHASRWTCNRAARSTSTATRSASWAAETATSTRGRSPRSGGSAASSVRGNATHELGPVEGPTLCRRRWSSGRRRASSGSSRAGWRRPRSPGTPCSRRASPCCRPAPGGELSQYPRENLLLPNPAGGARFAYAPGEAFVRPGIFRVTVERHALQSAALRFEWLDRVAPARPRLRVRTTRGRVRLSWDAARERGSGSTATRWSSTAEPCARSAPTSAHHVDGSLPGRARLPSGGRVRDRPGREPRTPGVGTVRIR